MSKYQPLTDRLRRSEENAVPMTFDGDGAAQEAGGPDWFAAFHGGLRGTVTIAPGTDLTAPVAEEWDAERAR